MAVAAVIFSLMTSCGSVYSVNSGVADEGYMTFYSDSSKSITVLVDDAKYQTNTVNSGKAYKKDRDVKNTAKNMITVKPGQHYVRVLSNGVEVYSKKVFVSASETKIIDL